MCQRDNDKMDMESRYLSKTKIEKVKKKIVNLLRSAQLKLNVNHVNNLTKCNIFTPFSVFLSVFKIEILEFPEFAEFRNSSSRNFNGESFERSTVNSAVACTS